GRGRGPRAVDAVHAPHGAGGRARLGRRRHGPTMLGPILRRVRIGGYDVEIFSDGILRLDGGAMFGVVPKVLWEKGKPADELNRVAMDMNCLLIRDRGGHVVVVETGAGPKPTDQPEGNFGIDTPPA